MQVFTWVNKGFEIYPWTQFSQDAKFTPLNKDFVGFCLKFDPQICLSLNNLSKFWQTTPFLLKYGFLDP